MDRIDSDFLKQLRTEKSWSQDQLAIVSGLSLRTIQRIEKSGSCSLESRKAIAAAFEISLDELEKPEDFTSRFKAGFNNRKNGFYGLIAGAGLSLLVSYAGYTSTLAIVIYSAVGWGAVMGWVHHKWPDKKIR